MLPIFAVLFAVALPLVFLQSLLLQLVPAVLLLQLPLSCICDDDRFRVWHAANSIVAAVFSPVVAGMCLIKILPLEPADVVNDHAANAEDFADSMRTAALFSSQELDLSPAGVAQQAELVLVMLLALAHMALALVEHCRCLTVLQFALNSSRYISASNNTAAAASASARAAAAGAQVAPARLCHSFWYVLGLSVWLVFNTFAVPIAGFCLVAYWLKPYYTMASLGLGVAGSCSSST